MGVFGQAGVTMNPHCSVSGFPANTLATLLLRDAVVENSYAPAPAGQGSRRNRRGRCRSCRHGADEDRDWRDAHPGCHVRRTTPENLLGRQPILLWMASQGG